MLFKRKILPTFVMAQSVVVGLFILLLLLAASQLREINNALSVLSSESVPTLSKALTVSTEVERLVTLTETLLHVQTEPARHTVFGEIQQVLKKLARAPEYFEDDSSRLSAQYRLLPHQLEKLNDITANRIQVEKQVDQAKSELFNYMRIAFLSSQLSLVDPDTDAIFNNIVILTAQIDQQANIADLQSLRNELAYQIESALIATSAREKYNQSAKQIEIMVLDRLGLIQLKIDSLTSADDALERGAAVRELVSQMAQDIQNKINLITAQTLDNAQKSSAHVTRQIHYALISAVIVILLSFLIIMYLYQKIVVRLVELTRQVQQAAQSGIDKVIVNGRDEIARLANTFSQYLKRVKSQEQELLQMTLKDPLTGIPNRRAFENNLTQAISHARRFNLPLTIMLIDIDFFKHFNDHYGHTCGDSCLTQVAQKLNDVLLRTTDFCARFGGEEFVAVLPDTEAYGAKLKALELLQGVEEMAIPHLKSITSEFVTVSIGAATFQFSGLQNWTIDTILNTADEALYQAKHKGRNQFAYLVVSGNDKSITQFAV